MQTGETTTVGVDTAQRNRKRPNLVRSESTPRAASPLATFLKERNPSCDPIQLEKTVETFLSLFREFPQEFMLETNNEIINDPAETILNTAQQPGVSSDAQIVVSLKPTNEEGFLGLFNKTLSHLRLKPHIFDLPTRELSEKLQSEGVVKMHKTTAFDRMVVMPDKENWNPKKSPAIVARWQLDSETLALSFQYSITVPGENGVPKDVCTAVVTETKTRKPHPAVLYNEDTPLSEKQSEVYWNLVLKGSKMALKRNCYPGACLIEPTGDHSFIIMAINGNKKVGDPIEKHAECKAMAQLTDWEKESKLYHPDMFSTMIPCIACSQMARENSISIVRYILTQPPEWNGEKILRAAVYNIECGGPALVPQKKSLIPDALDILKEANGEFGVFPGQFEQTIALNQRILDHSQV